MERYVAFLRGINVSGQKLISMEALREYFKMPGLQHIKTYIQSGNVVFDSNSTEHEPLKKNIERQLEKKLGYEVSVILRTLPEIGSVIKNNPFSSVTDGRKLYVSFLSSAPSAGLHDSVYAYLNEAEDARIVKKEVYFLCGDYAKTKFSNNLLEKKLGVIATTRNWNTVNKILEL